jgi:hypothetical protein
MFFKGVWRLKVFITLTYPPPLSPLSPSFSPRSPLNLVVVVAGTLAFFGIICQLVSTVMPMLDLML